MDQGEDPVVRRFIPDSPDFAWAYDNNRLAPAWIRGELSRYDRRLLLRYNRLYQRWEIWQMRTVFVPPTLRGLTAEAISQRAVFWIAIGEDARLIDDYGNAVGDQPVHPPLDNRVMPNVYAADFARRLEIDAHEIHRMMCDEEAREKKKVWTEEMQYLQDFIVDHKNQLYGLKDAHDMSHILHPTRSRDTTRAFSS
jgi:hypothetical protein